MKRGVKKEEATVYYQSFVASLAPSQKSFKIYNQKGDEKIRVPFDKVIEDIYTGKVEANAIGFLRYKI